MMSLPVHIGIIMDGNRRWARSRKKHPWDGHRAGGDALKEILKKVDELGIKHITLYLWSLKNESGRERDERAKIFDLVVEMMSSLLKEAKKRKSRIRFFGRIEKAEIKEKLEKIMKETEEFAEKSVNFCFMYDGQAEIVDACNEIISAGIKNVDEKEFKKHLYTKDLPPVDLIIRTGMSDGKRLSGFMLWDASYAELIFHETFFPDYTPKMLENDIKEFESRNRRFGK